MKNGLLLSCCFFLILIFACKKDNDQKSIPPVLTLNAIKAELFPMEIAVLKAENISMTAETYDATIGGQSVKLGADINTGQLAFIMPAIAEGSQELNVKIDNKDYVVNFTVKATIAVPDPDTYIDKALEDLTFSDAELDNIQAQFKDVEGNEHSLQHLSTLKQYTQSVKQTIAGLNNEEKKQLAAFMAANPLLFSSETNPTSYIDSFSFFKANGHTPEEMMDELFIRMENDKQKLYVIGGVALAAAYTGQGWLSAICGFAGIYKIYTINNNNIAGLSKAIMRFGEMLTDDIQGMKTSMYTFTKDKKYIMKVRSPYRKPNMEDINSTAILTQNLVLMLNEVGNVWGKINKVGSKIGLKLDGEAYHFKNVAGVKSRIYFVDPELLFITNATNSKVKIIKALAGPGGIELEFSTDETVAQDFTFDIMYKSATGESKLTFEATLELPNSLTIGDLHQGGMVAYIFQAGDAGYVAGETHGLISALIDQGYAVWGCYGTRIINGANGEAVGTGKQNTTDIISECFEQDIAAKLCYDLTLNGYTDWFLPSRYEIDKLYKNLHVQGWGGFSNVRYWASTEGFQGGTTSEDVYAYYCRFDTGAVTYESPLYKNKYYNVRAVRYF